jgi:hypothetical protein
MRTHGYGKGLGRGVSACWDGVGQERHSPVLVATRDGRSAVCQGASLFAAVASDVTHNVEFTYPLNPQVCSYKR